MTDPSFLSKPEQVSPEWINHVFRHGGYDYQIDDFSRESIGTGQIGENIRFTFALSENAPKSIVGKFMSPDPVSRETGIQQETYIKEVLFYQHLQSKVDIQTPEIFYVNCNPESHEFVILMEDLAPGQQGDQIQGCGVDDAALALEQLAKLHGPTWGDETLLQYKLLGRTDDEEKLSQLQMIYKMVLPGFLNRYAHRFSSEHIATIELMMELLPFYKAIYTGPKALIHCDYRLDNMMFGGAHPLSIVDWQTISLGCGLSDASYCLGTSLISAERLKEEKALLKHYLEVLASYKIDLSWNDCWKYYRAYSASGLIMAVIASMVVEETDRGNDMFVAMATRSCQQVIELECFDVIRKA
ncbi:MAG: phosphotransferase [Pseudomonadales bacterium]|nr:phosphotransferase [Pseudomonadales bacterium]